MTSPIESDSPANQNEHIFQSNFNNFSTLQANALDIYDILSQTASNISCKNQLTSDRCCYVLNKVILTLKDHLKIHCGDTKLEDNNDDPKPLASPQRNSDTDDESDTPHPCTRCMFVARNEKELEKHTSNVHNLKNLFNRSSRRIYDIQTRKEIKKAKVRVNGKVNYHCTICNRYLTTAYSYVTHRSIHSGQKLFSCKICGRKFRLWGFLKNHLKHIHSVTSKCDLGDQQDATSNESDKPEVGKSGTNFLNYTAIDSARVVINGSVFYRCEICDKKLTRVNYYLSHMTIHTGEKKFICHLCGKRFRLSTMLRIHVRLTHEHIKNFSCDVCHQKFGTSTNLAEHKRIHTGERPHVCAKCGKSFKQKSGLFVHNRTHTDHFPFRCVQCDAKFRIQSQLNYHMIKHTGERPFVCDACGKAFAIKSHLNRHSKSHIEGRPYPCTECTKDFRHKKNLKAHLKSCHKM